MALFKVDQYRCTDRQADRHRHRHRQTDKRQARTQEEEHDGRKAEFIILQVAESGPVEVLF